MPKLNPSGNGGNGDLEQTFNLNGPSSDFTGSSREPIACFEQGLLYRVADDDTWYFYNDSFDHEMKIMYLFGPNSEIEIGPKVTMTRQNDGWLRVSLSLLPGETEHFVSGKASGYSSRFDMAPLSDDHIAKLRRERHDKILGQSAFLLRNLAPSLSRHRMSVAGGSGGGGAMGTVGASVVASLISGGSAQQSAAGSMFAALASSLTSPYHQQQREIEQLAIQLCQANRSFFVDPIFFPSESSLGASIPSAKNFPWYRYKEVLPTRYHGRIRIGENVRPGDIVPGELGDTTFMCAVASLAEIPELVRRLFPVDEQTPHLAKLGAYRVRLVVDGLWTTILVDDYFPMRGLRPAFARHRSDPGELYLEILQKAYATRLGSYHALTAVNALHTLSDLTGFPCTRLDPEWEAARGSRQAATNLFESLLSYSRAGFIIVLHTPHAFDRAFAAQFGCSSTSELSHRYRNAGMKLGHAYNVQRLVMLRNKDLMLIKLRNPWSIYAEWSLDWSDQSSKWRENPDVADVCRFKPSNDGFFWMSFVDAIQWFSGGAVCRSRLSWYDYRIPGFFGSNGLASFAVEIDNSQGDDRASLAISLTRRRISAVGGNGGIDVAFGGAVAGRGGAEAGGGGGGMFEEAASAMVTASGGASSAANGAGNARGDDDDDSSAILLSIWKVDAGHAPDNDNSIPFHLLGNSSPNPERLTKEFNFLFSRDVSVEVVVEPGSSILVVPCCGSNRRSFSAAQAMVLSIQTSKRFATENFARSGDTEPSSSLDETRRMGATTKNYGAEKPLVAGFRSVPDIRGRGFISRDNGDLEIIRANYQRQNPNGTIDGYADAYSLS